MTVFGWINFLSIFPDNSGHLLSCLLNPNIKLRNCIIRQKTRGKGSKTVYLN